MPTWKIVQLGGGDLAVPAGIHKPDDWVYVDVPSVQLPAAEADLWDPAGLNAVRYRIMFLAINNDGGFIAAPGVYIGREANSAGGLGRPNYWLFNETLPFPGTTGWQGPYFIHGDDAIRGYATNANEVSVHFDVRRVI